MKSIRQENGISSISFLRDHIRRKVMEISGGFNISQLFDQTLQGVQNKGADLTAKMAEL